MKCSLPANAVYIRDKVRSRARTVRDGGHAALDAAQRAADWYRKAGVRALVSVRSVTL